MHLDLEAVMASGYRALTEIGANASLKNFRTALLDERRAADKGFPLPSVSLLCRGAVSANLSESCGVHLGVFPAPMEMHAVQCILPGRVRVQSLAMQGSELVHAFQTDATEGFDFRFLFPG